jgi:hypothetical protein
VPGSLAVFLLALGFGFGVRLALLAASGYAHFDRSRDLALVPAWFASVRPGGQPADGGAGRWDHEVRER